MSTSIDEPTDEPTEPTPAAPAPGLSPIALAAIAAIVAVVGVGVAVLLALGTGEVRESAEPRGEVVELQEMLNNQAQGGYAPPDGRRAEVGKSAPNLPLDFFDGTSGQLAQFTGKPLVINIWASTCAPCLKEMPDFEAVSQQRPEVQFLGVDYVDTEEAARRMIEQTGVTYPQVKDPTGKVGQALGAPNLPFTLFLDDQGIVRKMKSGAMTAEQLDTTLTELFG